MGWIRTHKTKKGERRYTAVVRRTGHPTQSKTFRYKDKADQWIRKVEALIEEGGDLPTKEARRRTLADAVDRYERDVLPRKNAAYGARQRKQLGRWRDELGAYHLSRITPARLVEVRDKLASETVRGGDRRSPATVNRYLAALSHLFTTAVREWGWLDNNPMRKVSRLSESRGRVKWLREDERKRLLVACRESHNAHLYPVVVLALSTGMRQGEILNLRRRDVDLERGHITVQHSKNGERRGVPLVGLARDALREHMSVPRLDTDLLFPASTPGPDGSPRPAYVRHAWDRAVADAGLDDFRFHDLRHTAASYLAMNGATNVEIASVLGHKTLAMVKRYSHIAPDHAHGVVAAMNERFLGGSGGEG